MATRQAEERRAAKGAHLALLSRSLGKVLGGQEGGEVEEVPSVTSAVCRTLQSTLQSCAYSALGVAAVWVFLRWSLLHGFSAEENSCAYARVCVSVCVTAFGRCKVSRRRAMQSFKISTVCVLSATEITQARKIHRLQRRPLDGSRLDDASANHNFVVI